jgi:hypothetical protein
MGVLVYFTSDAGLMARSRHSEGPTTGHLDAGVSWFPFGAKANAEMVPNIPSCHYMLLIQPSLFNLLKPYWLRDAPTV